jgi:hypothetical protein
MTALMRHPILLDLLLLSLFVLLGVGSVVRNGSLDSLLAGVCIGLAAAAVAVRLLRGQGNRE